MGRTALFLVMGLGVAMSWIGFQIYRSGQAASDTQYAYLKYTNARNLARAAVHATLRHYDRDTSGSSPAVGQKTKFNDGAFELDALWENSTKDSVRLVTKGTFAESTYTMKVLLRKETKPFPGVNGAIGIRASPLTFSTNGKASVDGKNYSADGSTQVGGGDKTGVATWTASDSAAAASALGSNASGTPPVRRDTTTANPMDYINEYISSADYRYGPGNYSAITWGSPSNPKIIVCDAGDDTTNRVKFTGNVSGWGILAVRGNLELGGNFDFRGLVVVFGTNNIIKFESAGTTQIVGGLIVAGNAGASLRLQGTGAVGGKVKYSSAALENAKNIGKLRYYTILDWYE